MVHDDTQEPIAPRRRRTRRYVLAGAAGAVAVLTAESIARPEKAYAGTDGDVVLGGVNTATSATRISSSSGIAFDANGTLYGVSGLGDAAGVRGETSGNSSGDAVLGETNAGVVGFGRIDNRTFRQQIRAH